MEQLNSYYLTPQELEPNFLSRQNMAWHPGRNVPRILPGSGGEPMRWTQSDESTNSTQSALSNTSSSPITNTSSYSPIYPSDNYNNTYYTSEYSDDTRHTSYTPASLDISSVRHTPLSLGWLPDTHLVNLYELVVKKGKEPHLELLSKWTATIETPSTVYFDLPSNPRKGVYPCQFPIKCGKEFNRPADLERHYRNVHLPMEQRDLYYCDRENCERSTKKGCVPFTRKDHYRDHLRDYHKEDIGCAKGGKAMDSLKREKAQRLWLKERKIFDTWWRCSKCLTKVYVKHSGWECEKCKSPCEEEQRQRRLKSEPLDDTYPPSACATCFGQGGIADMNGEWADCYNCQAAIQPSHASAPYYPLSSPAAVQPSCASPSYDPGSPPDTYYSSHDGANYYSQ